MRWRRPKRKLQVKRAGSWPAPRTLSTVQSASANDHDTPVSPDAGSGSCGRRRRPPRSRECPPDRLAVGDGGIQFPRAERIAERIHVRIGANAGVAEQIPGPADGVAAFSSRTVAWCIAAERPNAHVRFNFMTRRKYLAQEISIATRRDGSDTATSESLYFFTNHLVLHGPLMASLRRLVNAPALKNCSCTAV